MLIASWPSGGGVSHFFHLHLLSWEIPYMAAHTSSRPKGTSFMYLYVLILHISECVPTEYSIFVGTSNLINSETQYTLARNFYHWSIYSASTLKWIIFITIWWVYHHIHNCFQIAPLLHHIHVQCMCTVSMKMTNHRNYIVHRFQPVTEPSILYTSLDCHYVYVYFYVLQYGMMNI